jgi:hypothetical protein
MGLVGSTAITPTVSALERSSVTTALTNVDFPAPGGPVNPILRTGLPASISRPIADSAEGSPDSIIVMSLARARLSPACTRPARSEPLIVATG